jgi:CDP-diacylglycerol--serine O-phosphatidyltransferase
MTLFQPFDPEEENGRKRLRRLPQVPIRSVLPSLVTLVALCAGLTAIRMTIEGRYDIAIGLIVVAAALDGIDGRIARFLKSTSRFGAELDSIADFVNFGVAPAVLIYTWGLDELGSLGWIAVLVFGICAALRLARFNVGLESPTKLDWHAAYFFGVPAPAGAIVVMLPLYLEFVVVPHGFLTAPLTFVYTIAIGLLMVSRIPTWSGKLVGRRIARDMVAPMFVCGVLVVAFLVSYPWQTLMVGTIAYLASLPLSFAAFMRREQAAARRPEPPPPEAGT